MASTGLRMCTAILPSQCQIKPTGLWGRKWAVAATFSSPKPLGLICKRKSGSGWNGKYVFHWLKATECAHQLESTTLAAHNISDVGLSNCKHEIRVSDLSLVLICRRCTCDMAAGAAWDTVPV